MWFYIVSFFSFLQFSHHWQTLNHLTCQSSFSRSPVPSTHSPSSFHFYSQAHTVAMAIWLSLLWVIKMIMNSITWGNWIFPIYPKETWGGIGWLDIGLIEKVAIEIITEANCCGRGKNVCKYQQKRGEKHLASQLSLICQCQGQTQQHCDNLGESRQRCMCMLPPD